MKLFYKYIFISLVIILAFSACKKAVSDEFVSYSNNSLNDTSWAVNGYSFTNLNRTIFADVVKNTSIIDSFNYTTESKLSFGDSLQITFPAYSCTYINGSPITNTSTKIRAEITILKKKGDFVKYANPTTNIFSLLQASNYCDIKLTKDGQEVTIAPNTKIKIKLKDTTASSDMRFFTENIIKYFKDSLLAWSPSSDGKIDIWKDNNGGSTTKTLGYEFSTNRIRWFGAARYADSNIIKSKLNVFLSPNFTNKNTSIFVVLKNSKTVINLLADANNKTFFTYNIPTNTEFTLISVSKINGDYYLDSRVIKSANANPIGLLPIKKSLAFITDFIDKL
jgi:hypothetical protein